MDDRKRWTVSDKGGRRNGTGREGAAAQRLPVLKNGPLCLAVYGGRDLAGLPSTDSHTEGGNRRRG